MGIGTKAYESRRAMGVKATEIDDTAVASFLATVPANATAAQKLAMAQKFAHMIATGLKVGIYNTATAARIADILAGAE